MVSYSRVPFDAHTHSYGVVGWVGLVKGDIVDYDTVLVSVDESGGPRRLVCAATGERMTMDQGSEDRYNL